MVDTSIKIENNKSDIFIHNKDLNKITLIEVGTPSQDRLQTVETEKLRKYDLLANELALMYECRMRILPYVMSKNSIIKIYNKKYIKDIAIPPNVEAYIQTRVLKKTLEILSLTIEEESRKEIIWKIDPEKVIQRMEACKDGKPLGIRSLKY